MSIKEAREFVINSVLLPAIESENVTEKVKNVTKSQLPWLNSFRKVGDVYQYLLSTTKSRDDSVDELDIAGLNTYEKILPQFKARFQAELTDTSEFSDFNVGYEYSSREILSVAKQYDTRSGGIQVCRNGEQLEFIAIKVTLSGGKYENEWLIEDRLLKYFMKSIGDVFKESYDDNAAIIGSANVPIYTFVRLSDKHKTFTFKGIFQYISHFDENGKKWFQLAKSDSVLLPSFDDVTDQLNNSIKKASDDSSDRRKSRLKKAPKKAKQRLVTTVVYDRNPDVIAEVHEQASGYCQKCNKEAPFDRASNGKPYLEVHHKIRLADGGEDTMENTIALCPNCHRETHYGVQ